jgi:ABC-type antimicrobial peptide transport system permease subunit
MAAILARARAELRTSLRSSLALILMLGLFGGTVAAATAGARRQVSAYPRFLAVSGAPDAFVISAPAEGEVPIPTVDLARAAKLPQVARAAELPSPFAVATTPNGDVLWDGSLNIFGATGDQAVDWVTRPRILTGRLPDPDRVDEVAVGYRAHQDPRVHIGATIQINLVKPGVNPFEFVSAPPKEDLLPPIDVRVVGTFLLPGELTGSSDVFVSGAFYRLYANRGLEFPSLAVRLKGGVADFQAFAKGVDAISPGALVFSQGDEVKFVRQSTNLQSIALWLFAGLTALAGLLIFAQAVTRQTVVGATENPTLRALGMTPNQLVGVAMLRTAAIGVAGAVVAMVFAVALSPLTPIGLARLVEPNPGIAFDGVVLGLGGVILVALVPLLAALPAWRSARIGGDQLGTAAPSRLKPSVVADAFAKVGLPPTAVAGVRLALEPGRGRTAVPVRSTVLGITMALAAFAASFAFLGSYRHLLATPRLYGVDFDMGAGNPFLDSKVSPDIVRILRTDPAVAKFSGGNILQFVQVAGPGGDGQRVNIWAFDPIRGSLHPTIAEGRWPRSDNEIALGYRSMRAIHTGVGDSVRVHAGSLTLTMKVVGRGVFPEGGFGPGLGDGGGLTFHALKRFYPNAPENAFPIDLAPGANAAAATKRLNRELEPLGANITDLRDTPNLSNLKRIQSLPLLLAGLLALAGAATLMHTLVSSIRRRRRDLAILKTLGFLRGQVSAAVAWQATTLVILALLIGLPLGVAAGRWGWNLFANQLGVVPEPQVTILPLLLAIPATVLLANLIALIPGRAASRVQPAIVLRSE